MDYREEMMPERYEVLDAGDVLAGFRDEFLPSRFLRLDIREFDEEEVAEFARNWYLAVETTLQGDSDDARRQAATAGEDLIQAIQANERVGFQGHKIGAGDIQRCRHASVINQE